MPFTRSAPLRTLQGRPGRSPHAFIHSSAWKVNSRNFAITEFSEVRRFLCVLEHIHSSHTGVCCVRYAASGGRVKAQDSYLPFLETRARYLKATKKPH